MWAVHVATPGKPCAPGIWTLTHRRRCRGTRQLPGFTEVWCGQEGEHRRGTRRSSPPQPDQLWRLRPPSQEPIALSPPPNSRQCPSPRAHPRRPAPGKSRRAAALHPPTREKKIPWLPPCSPRRSPHLTPRAAHLGHTGGNARRRGDTGARQRLHGGHNLGEEPAANSSRSGEASSPVALVMRPSGLHPDWLLAQ